MTGPKFTKSPDSLVAAFEKVAPVPPATMRQMFGYPACFVNGNMFMGLFGDGMIVRLPEPERAKLLELSGAKAFEPMPGRPMKEYVLLPPSVVASTAKLKPWVSKALAYGTSLPPKTKKASKAKAKRPR